jgi:hypothetical protein
MSELERHGEVGRLVRLVEPERLRPEELETLARALDELAATERVVRTSGV